MKLSDFVAQFIANQKVKQVFLLPGGGNMHIVDSMGKHAGIETVAVLHEQAASIAADGYAQASGNLGVALVTTGPGGTNAITGVTGSWIESVPVMIISGQVKRPDLKPSADMRMLGFQEIDIVKIVSSITKYAVTITEPNEILFHLEKAVFLAISGRPGPVWIDIPLDVQATDIDEKSLKGFTPPIGIISCNNEVEAALKIIMASKRPVVLAGNGIRLSGKTELFIKVVEKLGIPILTTWKASDLLDENHPLFYGRPGTVAQRGANFIQQNSDCIISLGCRLDFGQIGYAQETFAREAKKIIVDIDPMEFQKFRFEIDVKIIANVADFLIELEKQIANYSTPDLSEWMNRCLVWKTRYPVVVQEYRDKKEYVSTYILVEEVSKQCVAQDVIVPCSSGSGADITSQTLKVKKGQRVLNSPGLGSMGFGLPQSIGACIATGKRTICLNGDGGFQLNIQELETIKRMNLPIVFFYLNNQGYLSIKVSQINYFEGRLVATDASSGLTLPDIQKIAYAYGIKSNKISNQSELEKGVREALDSKGPFICEVMIDPEERVSPKVSSAIGANGKMVSKPLEDLSPFLSREEFLENMIVKPLED